MARIRKTTETGLTAEHLRAVLDYDPETGMFTWKAPSSSRLKPGEVAGCLDTRGYHKIRVNYTKYAAHRLAWLFEHGRWPANDLDHINGDKSDNRIANLREATHTENMRNCRRRVRSLPRGVTRRRERFVAMISGTYLGTFDTVEAAQTAYREASAIVHGEFGRAANG